MNYYQMIPVEKDIYRITSAENVYMELLVGTHHAMLIDTGHGFGDVQKVVREITDKPLYIVNTHGHVDHTCGNFRFQEEVYIAAADMELLRRHNTPAFREHAVSLAEHARDFVTGEEIDGLPEDFDRSTYLAGDVGHIRTLTEGMIFDLGGKTIRTIATPGHTHGSMSFLYEERNWLYVGDAANMFLWLFDDDATDKETYVRTLDKILALAPERIYGGHAPQPFRCEDVRMFKRAALEADYEHGIPFVTPLMPDCQDVRICILGDKNMEDIGKPGFYAILLDSSRK